MSRKTSSDLRKVLLAGAVIAPALAGCASKSQSKSTHKAPEPVATARGAPIAQIDPRPLQATLAQDEANTARDQASLTNAQAVLDRYTGVASKGLVTDQQVDAQRSQTAQLRATVAADPA